MCFCVGYESYCGCEHECTISIHKADRNMDSIEMAAGIVAMNCLHIRRPRHQHKYFPRTKHFLHLCPYNHASFMNRSETPLKPSLEHCLSIIASISIVTVQTRLVCSFTWKQRISRCSALTAFTPRLLASWNRPCVPLALRRLGSPRRRLEVCFTPGR